MKKLLALCLTVILMLLCFTSCSLFTHKKNQWFSEEKLAKCLVSDMPQLDCDYVKESDKIIYASLTEAEFNDYLNELYDYLKAKNFKYLGTRGEVASSLSGLFTTYYLEPATELSEFNMYSGTYKFVYSDGQISMSIEDTEDFTFCILTVTKYETNQTVEYGMREFDYNCTISLKFNSEYPLGGTYILKEHEHTITYVSAGEVGHFENYTCGCPQDFGAVPHYDENMDCICDACGYDMNEDYPPLVDETVSLTQFASWLTELDVENVAEIKTTFEYVGVAPGRLKDISRTTDKTVIADVIDKYANTEMRPVAREETYIDGGSAFTIEFTLTDGTVKQLYFNNGFYAYGLYEDEISALCYFELCSIPTLKDYDNVTKSNGFITYTGIGAIHDGNNNFVCEIPVSELEFVESDGCVDVEVTGYYYTVETEFGTLWFDYSNDLFYLRFDEGEVNYREYYRLVGKNLDELIAEYSNNE